MEQPLAPHDQHPASDSFGARDERFAPGGLFAALALSEADAGTPAREPMSPALEIIIGLIALLAIVVPAIMIGNPPPMPKPAAVVVSKRIVPKTEIPKVDPVILQAVARDDAVAFNESVPFSTEANIPARAFTITGSDVSQARAVDCLAAAVYYEAGDDTGGQKPVAQVVLNRMRHPAFPKSVCGVVFQGSERTTGCQFSFTCDGSMLRRTPSPAAWERARAVARMALHGNVDKDVGLATHYHTDWVVPYWSASLEKITAIRRGPGTHLFFRWAGWWGTPAAFNRGYAGFEPNVGKMALVSANFVPTADSPIESGLLPGAASTAIDPEAIPQSIVPAAITGDNDSFLVTLPKGMSPDSFASLAIRTCGDRPHCKFMAWADGGKTPGKLPLNSVQVATMSFSYLRDQNQGFGKALWNCGQYQRPSPVQCMRAQPLARLPVPAASVPGPQSDLKTPAAPEPLSGVRRKAEPTPVPTTPEAKPRVTLTLPVSKATPAATARD